MAVPMLLILIGAGALVGLAALAVVLFLLFSGGDHDGDGRRE